LFGLVWLGQVVDSNNEKDGMQSSLVVAFCSPFRPTWTQTNTIAKNNAVQALKDTQPGSENPEISSSTQKSYHNRSKKGQRLKYPSGMKQNATYDKLES
jgi:hypothetical protein